MIRECETRWQCLPEGQLSLSKQDNGSKVADVTISSFPQSPLKCQKQQKEKRSAEARSPARYTADDGSKQNQNSKVDI
jgi:hypothetical protein